MQKPYKSLIFRQFWSADKYTTTFNWLVFRSASEVDYVITSFGKYGYDTIDVRLNYTTDLSGQYPVYHITGDKALPMGENPTFTNVDWRFTYTPANGMNGATLNKGQLQFFYYTPRP